MSAWIIVSFAKNAFWSVLNIKHVLNIRLDINTLSFSKFMKNKQQGVNSSLHCVTFLLNVLVNSIFSPFLSMYQENLTFKLNALDLGDVVMHCKLGDLG